MQPKERDQLLKSVVTSVADYRSGEIAAVDEDHVLAWLDQFDKGDRTTILRELAHLLNENYISKNTTRSFIRNLAKNESLVGADPEAFWSELGYLRVQPESQSQGEMLKLLDEDIAEEFGLSTACEESAASKYLYLDDVSFSGNQIRNDLLQWAEKNDIHDATVHIVAIVLYSLGKHYTTQGLREPFKKRGITFTFGSPRASLDSKRRLCRH